MLSHGDEVGRTQRGNNNAYAQDNEVSWMHWDLDERRRELLAFARRVFAIRRLNPVLRRRTFFRGEVVDHAGVKDLTWLRADGQEMAEGDWGDGSAHSLGMLIHGDATDETDEREEPIKGDTMLLLVNASDAAVRFALPVLSRGEHDERGGIWTTLVDTANEGHRPQPTADAYDVQTHSLVLLRWGRDRRLAGPSAPNLRQHQSA
jgi:isoamylase